MLKFDRHIFRSGVIVVKELVSEEGQPEKYLFHRFFVKDKGQNFEFQNEACVLQKYPNLFTVVS